MLQDFTPKPPIGGQRKTSHQDFLPEDSARRPLYANSAVHRVENSWWPSNQNEGSHAIRERDNNGAVAGELVSRIAGCLNMAGYLKAAGATCASTGNPHQYHPHGHPMGVGTHPHPHSHPHPGAHPGLPSHFALTPHAHTHHALEHGLAAAFPQGKTLILFQDEFKFRCLDSVPSKVYKLVLSKINKFKFLIMIIFVCLMSIFINVD